MERLVFSKFCELLANNIVKTLNKGKSPRYKWKIYDAILKLMNPVVNVYVGNNKLKMLLSQKTPYYYASFPTYDRALPRICEMIQKIDKKIIVIDIGANIGDTASLISEKTNGASILCIEGDKNILPFLYENTISVKNNTIYIEPKHCVNILENNKYNIENIDTLDNILNKHTIFKDANVLKIDTDGFEINVLNSAKELLRKKHPMIFFEFTPEAYILNNQNPMDLIKLLNSFGYDKALFYDNFGSAKGIYHFHDNNMIQKLIEKIGTNKIHFYDILCIHKTDEEKYVNILEYEMGQKNGA